MCLGSFPDHPIHPPKFEGDPWVCDFPPDCGYNIRLVSGVFQITDPAAGGKKLPYEFPDLDEFVGEMNLMCALIADGPLKSFCYRRLSYLSSKFQLHVLLNELRELAEQKTVAHRDFYNVRKVRTSCSAKTASPISFTLTMVHRGRCLSRKMNMYFTTSLE